MHMYPALCIWNEYAFKKLTHKSSKGSSEHLEGGQPQAADGAAVVGKGERSVALDQLGLCSTDSCSGMDGTTSVHFTIYEVLSHTLSSKFMKENTAILSECRVMPAPFCLQLKKLNIKAKTQCQCLRIMTNYETLQLAMKEEANNKIIMILGYLNPFHLVPRKAN